MVVAGVLFIETILGVGNAIYGKMSIAVRSIAYSAAFFVAFFLAYFMVLAVPLTQGWFVGNEPLTLNEAFVWTFGGIIITALVVAPGVAVATARAMATDATLVMVVSIALGLGTITTDRIPPYIAVTLRPIVAYIAPVKLTPDTLALDLAPAVIMTVFILTPVAAYGLAAVARDSSMNVRIGPWRIGLSLAVVVLLSSLAVLVWLCWLGGWQTYVTAG